MPITIPERVAQFLERATVGIGGTRDANLVPHVHRLSGWAVRDGREAITCLVAQPFTTDLQISLEDNGEFALTVSEVPSHETYQLKGSYLGSRAPEAADIAQCDRHRERFAERIGELFGFPDELVRAYVPEPSFVFDFAVREIFIQTPGPEAGVRLAPPAERSPEP